MDTIWTHLMCFCFTSENNTRRSHIDVTACRLPRSHSFVHKCASSKIGLPPSFLSLADEFLHFKPKFVFLSSFVCHVMYIALCVSIKRHICCNLGQNKTTCLGLILFYLLFPSSASGRRDWCCLNTDHKSRQS